MLLLTTALNLQYYITYNSSFPLVYNSLVELLPIKHPPDFTYKHFQSFSKFLFLFADMKGDDLKAHMMEEVDYHLLPVVAWDALLKWYGLVEGSVPVKRVVQEHGQYVKDLKVEVYLTKLKLCRNSDMEECVVKTFSKTATLGMYCCCHCIKLSYKIGYKT